MKYYAHSPKDGVDAQTYAAHVRGVCSLAQQYANEAGTYSKTDGEVLRQLVENAAEYHDIGKLDEKNQDVLSGKVKAKSLPVNHVDAGAAHWLTEQNFSPLTASVIQAHHIGFPNYSEEHNKGEMMFRDVCIAADTDKKLLSYEAIQASEIGNLNSGKAEMKPQGDPSMFMRMLLSCLADADHTNTAQHYGKYSPHEQTMLLRAEERLARLNRCVENLQKDSLPTDRNRLRSQMYYSCRDAATTSCICSCDSPVGSGKTTSVMAHLLKQAQNRGLRRIFIVLPFTNIIRQSVDIYRDMLVLPGEAAEDVVAELHHMANFESEDARHLTALWQAPIIVTTAVAFFETLASNSPSALRRLHELPGSAIFVDESHAAVPASLLPITWHWIRLLSNEWNCYWVLASGSLSRFWSVRDIVGNNVDTGIAEIVSNEIRDRLLSYESGRICYRHDLTPRNTEQLAKWISTFPGPRLVILNTVQSAAVVANFISHSSGRKYVEHLSTSLTPNDRDTALEHIKTRLKDETDTNWTLVATSCVEAGMDISFRTGFHELSSLSSLLQAAGRVNREGKFSDAEMWTFRIAEDGMLKLNPGLNQAGRVLNNYFDRKIKISPSLTTQYLADEIAMYGLDGKNKRLIANEKMQNFQSVEHDFKVIDSDTELAVVDEGCVARLQNGELSWRELQKVSVRISKCKLQELNIPQIIDDIYIWNLGYDSFLGYMAGIIKHKHYSEAIIV